jgi:hypothetical protein
MRSYCSIKDRNFMNLGTFAILEVSEESVKTVGYKYMVTPLKPVHTTFSEKQKVNEDLHTIREAFGDAIYCSFRPDI